MAAEEGSLERGGYHWAYSAPVDIPLLLSESQSEVSPSNCIACAFTHMLYHLWSQSLSHVHSKWGSTFMFLCEDARGSVRKTVGWLLPLALLIKLFKHLSIHFTNQPTKQPLTDQLINQPINYSNHHPSHQPTNQPTTLHYYKLGLVIVPRITKERAELRASWRWLIDINYPWVSCKHSVAMHVLRTERRFEASVAPVEVTPGLTERVFIDQQTSESTFDLIISKTWASTENDRLLLCILKLKNVCDYE